jgi:hypothetical protein
MTAVILSLAFFLHVPPPGDAYRLPPYEALEDGRAFNWRYQANLKWLLGREIDELGQEVWLPGWRPRDEAAMRTALAEAKYLEEVWSSAIRAHPDSPYTQTRHEHLRHLRLLIGPDAYRRMELPPPAPYWRFSQLR